MKILADENIPLVDYYFGSLGECITQPGRDIQQNDLVSTDILLVRSVTRVDRNLLENTPVRFVGSATTGFDHLDVAWLEANHIAWSAAKGCNAKTVVEYILCSIAALQKEGLLLQPHPRAGIIGVGEIGSDVSHELKKLGFDVIECDPIRAEQEKNFSSVALDDFENVDLVTIHTPLTYQGDHPTYHLIEKNFLQRQKKGCVLFNTARGEVIHSADLKKYGQHLLWCLDVFENEPAIDLDILQRAIIATPHIAGYSIQSKYRGVEMIYHAAIQKGIIPDLNIPTFPYTKKEIALDKNQDWRDTMLAIFDPRRTSKKMKAALMGKTLSFDLLRKHFSER